MNLLETRINHFIRAMICYSKQNKNITRPRNVIRITSTYAKISLQSLIHYIITRLSITLEEILCSLNDNERNSLKIICKWSCDGSQQAKYKQRFEDATDTYSNMFLRSFVPLRITCGKEGKKN